MTKYTDGTPSGIASSGAVEHNDGSAAVPGISFTSDSATGLYNHEEPIGLGMSVSGVKRIGVHADYVDVTDPIHAGAGSVDAPTYTFDGETDTGIYKSAADEVSIALGGAQSHIFGANFLESRNTGYNSSYTLNRTDGCPIAIKSQDSKARITFDSAVGPLYIDNDNAGGTVMTIDSNSDVTFAGDVVNSTGTAAAPTLRFTDSGDTGLYYDTDGVAMSTGGVKRMKVAPTHLETTNPVYAPVGATSDPSFAFTTATGMGMYACTSVKLGFTTAGADRMTVNASRLRSYVPLECPNSSAAAPGVKFTVDDTTGMYAPSAGILGFSAAGSEISRYTTSGMELSGVITGAAGSASAPTYSFSTDSNSGLYSDGQNVVGISTGGNMKMCADDSGIAVVDGTSTNPSYGFIDDRTTGIYSAGASLMGVTTGGTTATTFNSSGLSLNAGTTLGTYNEGTWNVKLEDGSATGATLIRDDGFYTQIGNVVFFEIDIQWVATIGMSGNIQINLPIAGARGQASIRSIELGVTDDPHPIFEIRGGAVAYLGYHDASDGVGRFTAFTDTDIQSADIMVAHGWYFTT